MIIATDLNIESQFDFTCVYNQLINNTFVERKIEKEYLNYLSIGELKYINSQYSFLYPIHKTIQDELEKEGLEVINFNKDDDIDGLTSYEFEVNDNGYNVAEIEYKIIKNLNLASKNISITVY